MYMNASGGTHPDIDYDCGYEIANAFRTRVVLVRGDERSSLCGRTARALEERRRSGRRFKRGLPR